MKETFNNVHEMQEVIRERGFLPFFAGEIPSFSIEEFCPDELWFADDQEGPWEWKSQAIVEGDLAYGKFFRGKAGFISMEWFPDFVNYRRSIIQLTPQEEQMLAVIQQHQSLLSREVKRLCGYTRPRRPRITNPIERMMAQEAQHTSKRTHSSRESYETAITRLQMATRIVTADFEYSVNKQGRRYGWSIARYCTPEDFFGAERLQVPRTPQESLDRLMEHLLSILPHSTPDEVQHALLG